MLNNDNSAQPKQAKELDIRRRFLKKAALSSALISTVASKSAWANKCTISGNLSNNASNHDSSTHCQALGYSHGGWKNGHANNNNYWQFTGFTKESYLFDLLGQSPVENLTIGQALTANGKSGYANHALWFQRATAALNLKLWETMKTGVIIPNIHQFFYFETTMFAILQASNSTLEDANSI